MLNLRNGNIYGGDHDDDTQQLLMVMGRFEPEYWPKMARKIPSPWKEPENTERLPNGDRHSKSLLYFGKSGLRTGNKHIANLIF